MGHLSFSVWQPEMENELFFSPLTSVGVLLITAVAMSSSGGDYAR